MATALGYALAGTASLPLAIPPGFASPLYLAAGVALAAVLIAGPWMLGAIALGSFSVNLWLQIRLDPFAPQMLALSALIGAGAAAQAAFGAWLVRRRTEQPLTLSHPRDVLQFLACAAASCAVSTGTGNLGLWWTRHLPPADLPASLAAWWVGDVLGVLIVTPILLTLLGRPRSAWAPRRLSVGLTLALTTILLAVGIHWVTQVSVERRETAFRHEATSAFQALSTQLREPLLALDAMHGAISVSDHLSAQDMRNLTRDWLAPGVLQAIAWGQALRRDDIASLQAQARADGQTGYTVFDRGADDAPPTDDVVALRYIEPLADNAAALGLNVLSIPATRAAIERTRRSGEPAATAGFRLTQQRTGKDQVGVVVYRALLGRGSSGANSPDAPMRGVVSVVLRMQDQIAALMTRNPTHLAVCLIDVTPGTPVARLAGEPGCEVQHPALAQVQALNYAGRVWQMQVSEPAGAASELHNTEIWLFALVGLLSTAMLGGFLLTVTGRANRIENAVRERTAALQAEVREREVAEAALRESEQRFRNILNNVPIGVVYTDLRGRIKQANPRFCELTGYAEAELLRLSLSDCTHPQDMEVEAALMGQLVRGEIPMYRGHKRYITLQGHTVWVQATVSLLRDAKGLPRSIVGVVEDITEHLRLEEAERARETAEASNRAKSEFLSRMSHELRTPLNAMLGFAQLLELDPRHALAPSQRPWISQIQQAGWHLLNMINDVLDLSRIESDNLKLHTENLNLATLLEATVAMVQADAGQRGIVISLDVAPGAATVLGDATRVKQILTNLLSNAVKYNVDGGRIHIGVRALGADEVEIIVTDTGLGMTPEQLAELFQPFNRLGREDSAKQGTGIGLVISKRLAETMGGTLRARSVSGQGSAFVLTLPCSSDLDTVRSDLDEFAPMSAQYHRRIVHYVEDNETNVEVMRGILAQRPQVEMRVSFNGRDGLASIRSQLPDLILLDLHLPDMSGLEILRLLKSEPATASIPIIIVSADAMPQQVDAALAAGCDRYLTKPVNINVLLQLVDELLERVDTGYG